MRQGILRIRHQSRSQQDFLYDMEYSLNRSSEYDHLREEYSRYETPPGRSHNTTRESCKHSHHVQNSSCTDGLHHQDFPANEAYIIEDTLTIGHIT